MGITGSVIAYLIIWWTVLFTVLPMRVTSQAESKAGRRQGTDPGAPVDAMLWFKAKRTTWISFIVWAIVFVIVISGVIWFDR